MKHLKDNYSFSVQLKCIVCGHDDCFESNDDKSFIKCTNCGKEYFGGYDELVDCNNEIINEGIDAKTEEIHSDVVKEINDMIKNAFSGNKHIKIK